MMPRENPEIHTRFLEHSLQVQMSLIGHEGNPKTPQVIPRLQPVGPCVVPPRLDDHGLESGMR